MGSPLIVPSGAVVTNYTSFLPGLLTVDQSPMSLADRAPFEPVFSTRMPRRMVHRSSRQIGKTRSIVGRIIIDCAMTPGHKVVVVTPLQEQSDLLSSTIMKPMIFDSPIRTVLWSGEEVDNIRRREFRNRSLVHFTYAFLSTDRARSKTGSCLYLDESIPYDALILTPHGEYPIGEILPGTPIYGFNEKGQICVDHVKSRSYHGVRDCYRLEFSDGSAVEATSDSWIATTAGWRRVETIITDAGAGADAARDDARGREFNCSESFSGLSRAARVETTRVQLPKVPGVIRVRTDTTQESEERRLRGVVESLEHVNLSGLLPYSGLVSPGLSKTRQPGVVGPVDVGRDRLVVHGRRFPVEVHGLDPHPGVLTGRESTPGRLVDGTWYPDNGSVASVEDQSQQDLVLPRDIDRGDVQTGRNDPTVRLSGNALQNRPAGTTDSDLLGVRDPDRSDRDETTRLQGRDQQQLLQRGMSDNGALGGQKGIHGYPRESGKEERVIEESLREYVGRTAEGTESVPDQLAEGEQRKNAGIFPEVSGQEAGGAEIGNVDLCRMWTDRTPRRPENEHEILSQLPKNSDRPDQEEIGGENTICQAELVRITWIGQHPVYDIETENNHTFFAGGVAIHNCQDLDPSFVPVLEQCLASSMEPSVWISGTSKTKDTFLETEWLSSSQGVWHVKCDACGFDNICAVEPDGHLLSMIGPVRDDISEKHPGTLCHQCRRPVNPRYGRWVHRCPEREHLSAGYYAPQPIFPFHFANPHKWSDLVGRMNGAGGYTTAKFYNECLGEAFDVAYKLLSVDDLKVAGQGIGPNTEETARARRGKYKVVVLGVDWGGGGEEGVSRTKAAACGLTADGRSEVFHGVAFPPGTDRIAEAKEILKTAKLCGASLIAHDVNGGGTASEAALTHLGWPVRQIAPMAYRGTIGGSAVEYHKPAGDRLRGYYSLDRSRTLAFLCAAIRAKKVWTFDYNREIGDDQNLLGDFLNLVQEKTDTPTGNVYRIRCRSAAASDDFATACDYGLSALWELTGGYPSLTGPGLVNPDRL